MKALLKASSGNQLAICPITGITFHLTIQGVEGKYLEWDSPLSSPEIIKQYSSLSQKELRTLPTSLIAGLILGTLHHHNLLLTKIEAFHINNRLASTISSSVLVYDFLSLSFLKRSSKTLPQLQISSSDDLPEVYINYLTTIRQLTSGSYFDHNREASASSTGETLKLIAAKSSKMNSKQLDSYKVALKTHYKNLVSDKEIPQKLLTLLALITRNEALRVISDEVKNKVIKALGNYENNPSAKAFASILTKTLGKGEDIDLGTNAIVVSHRQKTMAEIIAEKTRTKEDAQEIWDSTIQEVSFEVDITSETEEDLTEEEKKIEEGKENPDEF